MLEKVPIRRTGMNLELPSGLSGYLMVTKKAHRHNRNFCHVPDEDPFDPVCKCCGSNLRRGGLASSGLEEAGMYRSICDRCGDFWTEVKRKIADYAKRMKNRYKTKTAVSTDSQIDCPPCGMHRGIIGDRSWHRTDSAYGFTFPNELEPPSPD